METGSGDQYVNTTPGTIIDNDTLVVADADVPTSEGRKVGISNAVKLYAFCAAVNSCNLGYDIGVTTNVGPLIQEDFNLSDIQLELFVGSINFWSIFGAFSSQYCSDRYGRRATFTVAAILFIIGCILMSSATTYNLLLFGRIFVGIGIGNGLAIDPLYIAEISPTEHRGYLVTWSEFALNIGIVLGFSTGLLLSSFPNNVAWRIMILLGTIMPVIMILLVLFVMPESPRWLVSKNDDVNATIVLQRIYANNNEVDVDDIITNIKQSLERERMASGSMGWDAIFCNPTPAIKRMVLIGVFVAASQQLTGVDAIQYYLNTILERSFDDTTMQSYALIGLGMMRVIFIFVAAKLFDVVGRKALLSVSLLGISASLLLISISFYVTESTGGETSPYDDSFRVVTFVGLVLYFAFFSFGVGPAGWLIPSEIFALSIRAKSMSVATCVNRIIATTTSSTFLSVKNLLGWDVLFLAMSVSCLIIYRVLYVYLPETKDKSLEDMSLYFAQITNDNSMLEAEQRIKQSTATSFSEIDLANTQSGGKGNNNSSGMLT